MTELERIIGGLQAVQKVLPDSTLMLHPDEATIIVGQDLDLDSGEMWRHGWFLDEHLLHKGQHWRYNLTGDEDVGVIVRDASGEG